MHMSLGGAGSCQSFRQMTVNDVSQSKGREVLPPRPDQRLSLSPPRRNELASMASVMIRRAQAYA